MCLFSAVHFRLSLCRVLWLGLILSLNPASASFPRARLDACNVTWTTPGGDARGSMPLGNGDIGLNVWMEESGDLLFHIGKTDAWDESMRLVKVGGVRVKCNPALDTGAGFSQTLDLATGTVFIRTPGRVLRLWVDALHPVVRVEGRALDGNPFRVEASPVLWRSGQAIDPGYDNFPGFPKTARPDTLLRAENGRIGWMHANNSSPYLENMALQNLEGFAEPGSDPIRNRVFGALMQGPVFTPAGNARLHTTAPVESFLLNVHVHTEAKAGATAWKSAIAAKAEAAETLDPAACRSAHEEWWDAFWSRSWIYVKGEALEIPDPLQHPWRLGEDSNGGSLFRGSIEDAWITGRALDAAEITALASIPHSGNTDLQGTDARLSAGFGLSAWIKPEAGEKGRIFDKVTAGKSDGVLLDTHPGLALRLIVGSRTLAVPGVLTAGQWQHVAATADAASGVLRVYRNGVLVAEQAPAAESDADKVSGAYARQRFINACGGRGAYPIKFNGSIFTVPHGANDADYRRWGGCYWFMNTRLIYWSMPMAGDLEMMLPLFHFYRDLLPLRKKATQAHYGHAGACFPETITIWGTYNNLNYGTDRNGKPDGLTDNQHIRYYWQGGLELIALMLDYYDHSRDEAFLADTLTPLAREILLFFRHHWPKDADGKIRFEPAQALECHWVVVNPAPEVAGLRFVLPRLLELPLDEALKQDWRDMLGEIPPVPVAADAEGRLSLQPGDSFSPKRQSETPELYPVFPYRLHTMMNGPEALQTGRNTWAASSKKNNGWGQTPIMAAMLGLAEEAKTHVVGRVQSPAAGVRFPAFWGPNDDWTPDQDQVNIMLTALQRMLVQTEDGKIRLLPAWPASWSADFKLQAPQNTSIRGTVSKGKLTSLSVSPAERLRDVSLADGSLLPAGAALPFPQNSLTITPATPAGEGDSDQWTLLSGPAAFRAVAHPPAAHVLAFSAPGTYVVELRALRGGVPFVDSMTVTVGAAENKDAVSYADWARGLPADARGPLDDPDGDGVANLLEFAMGGDAADPGDAPRLSLLEENGVRSLTWPLSTTLPADVYPLLEESGGLLLWQPAAIADWQFAMDGLVRRVRARLPNAAGTRRFYRLAAKTAPWPEAN